MPSEDIGALVVRIEGDLKDFESKMTQAEKKAQGFGGMMKNALSFAGGLAITGGIGKIAEGLAAGAKMGMDFNSTMEQAKGAFTTMLGSGEKASEMLKGLTDFAAKTPFELTDLTKASQTLLAFGLDAESVMPSLKMLGDASLGNKDKFDSLTLAFAQVQSQGKLMGQDVLQMVNAGFNPLQIISEKTGESMASLKDKMSKGAISADMVTEAFKTATSEGGRFNNAMETQSKTFAGQMSTLKDAVTSTFGKVLQPAFEYASTTLVPALSEKITQFSDFITANMPTIQVIFKTAMDTISTVLKNVWDVLEVSVIPTLAKLYDWIKPNLPTIQKFFEDAMAGIGEVIKWFYTFMSEKILPVLQDLLDWVTPYLPDIQKVFEDVFGVIKIAVETVWNIFETFLLPILKTLLAWILPNLPKISSTVKNVFSTIQTAVQAVVDVFNAVSSAIETAIGWLTGWNKTPADNKTVKLNAETQNKSLSSSFPSYAGGTNFHPGGMAIVGEKGPELVNLPRGSNVIPNNQSNVKVDIDYTKLVAAMKSAPIETTVNIDGQRAAKALWPGLVNEKQRLGVATL